MPVVVEKKAALDIEAKKLAAAKTPEEYFGNLGQDPEEQIKALDSHYKSVARLVHPDVLPREEALQNLGALAFDNLRKFRVEAKLRIQKRLYGTSAATPSTNPISLIESEGRVYRVMEQIASGQLANIYRGEYTEEEGAAAGQVRQVTLKVAREPQHNNFLRNERILLTRLWRNIPKEMRALERSLPRLVDKFTTSEGQEASVFEFIDGRDFFSLRERADLREGLMPRDHIWWITERALHIAGYLHSQGIIHGNIHPGHLILKNGHDLALVDFCFAVANPGSADYVQWKTDNYSAPEVAEGKKPLPTMDLYGIGKSLVYLLGGDPETGRIPDDVDPRFAEVLSEMIDPDYTSRTRDAWTTLREVRRLREEVFGKIKYVDFVV